MPLLEAIGWTGRPRHLSEAVPHFVDNIDTDDFRETLANLNLTTVPIRTRQDRLNPAVLPCLFVPDKGPVRVVLERVETETEDGQTPDTAFRIYDGFTRSIRTAQCKGSAARPM